MRVAKATGVIDAQLAALDKIVSEGPAGVVAERLRRWADTASQALTDAISPSEGKRFWEHAFRAALIFGKHKSFDGLAACRDFAEALKRDLKDNPQSYFSRAPAPSALPQPVSPPGKSPATVASAANVVFIVHGHDEANALKLEALLRARWKLETVVLKNEPHKGRTLIDKFEEEAERAGFALVLLSPDDLVQVQDAVYLQSRPNVFFELGWFYGRLRRERTCLVWKTGGKLPSDLGGIGRVEFANSVDEAFLGLERELAAAGLIPKPT